MSQQYKGTKPTVDHIVALIEDSDISRFIMGHLIVEGVLIHFLEAQPNSDVSQILKWNFPTKVVHCKDAGLCEERMASFLLLLNTHRNQFAHRLGHRLDFKELFGLAQTAAAAGVDFSDDGIHNDLKYARASYDSAAVISEIFSNTALDLSFAMQERGVEFLF